MPERARCPDRNQSRIDKDRRVRGEQTRVGAHILCFPNELKEDRLSPLKEKNQLRVAYRLVVVQLELI